MKTIQQVHEALEGILRAEGLTPAWTYTEAIERKHVAAAWINSHRVFVPSKEIGKGTYGHPKLSVEARLEPQGWVLWGQPKTGKIVPLFEGAA